MKLYLVRHGHAIAGLEDSARQLSAKGIQEVHLVGKFLNSAKIHVDYIYHSGKKRAEQTAVQLGSWLNFTGAITPLVGLAPEDPVRPIAVHCNQWYQDIILVSHLPFLDKLASELLFDYDDKIFTRFQPGSVLCLERAEVCHWNISWFIYPGLLQAL